MTTVIRILLVDDHPMFRFGIRAFVEATPDMAVVGEAGTGEEAVSLCAELHPDIVNTFANKGERMSGRVR